MKTKQLILCALFAALTVSGVFVKIPVPGTPLFFTLQTFFVFLTGLLLEAKYALIAQLVYAAVGLVGLPVFSTGGGIAYVLSPSFGFIIGFCVCAPITSVLVRSNLSKLNNHPQCKMMMMLKIIGGAIVSIIAMYVFGVTYMYIIYNLYLKEPVTLGYVIVSSTGIFFFIDMAKMTLAVLLGRAILRRMPK
ncbi:MAG: biotin transporter BioY [Christensenellales bacterium]|jgi:biotin transport system substrate-specific component